MSNTSNTSNTRRNRLPRLSPAPEIIEWETNMARVLIEELRTSLAKFL